MALDDSGNGPYRLLRGTRRELVERFLASVVAPQAAEARALGRVLDAVRGTALGQRLALDRVRTVEEYRRAVPIRSFEDHADDLRRVAAGEAGVLTRHQVRSLVKTSGTTGEPKLLPVTDPWSVAVADAQALWVIAMVREQEEVVRGRSLVSVGPADEGRSAGGLVYGANTGRMALAQPWLVRRRYAVPYEVFTLSDPDVRHYTLLRLALAEDVRTWTTANPSTLLALARAAERWHEELARDLADGTLTGPGAEVPLAMRRWWWWRLRRRVRLADGPIRLACHWSSLAAINCWKGGAAPFYLARLPAALGREVRVREAGISASEGYFGIPLHSSWAGGVAWTEGHLLELLPEDGGPARSLHEAEVGCDYRLVVSTTAGLYRYDMNDVVRVVGWWGRAPLMVFLRKGRDVSSVTGEKVTAGQVAVAAALAVPGARGFSVGVRLAERATYVLCVEGEVPDPAVAAAAFDAELRRLNPEYDGKRDTDRLTAAVCELLPEGTYARYRSWRLAAGAADGQVKDLVLAHGDDLSRLLGGWR